MLSFAHSWLFLLLPLPFLVRWLLPASRRSRPAVLVPFLDRVQLAQGGCVDSRTRWNQPPGVVSFVTWILMVAALARPQWVEPPIEKNIPTRDLLLLVDLSASMVKDDFTNAEGQQVDRLVAVKEVVGDFLLKREGDRVGLAVFGSSPFLQVPFTTDLELCRQLLEETAIGMAGPRTALGDAIGLGINLFEDSGMEERTIIALTDGNDTASQVPPVEAARIARNRGIRIHAVAIGDPQTVGEEKLDEAALRDVAETASGNYFLAMNREELESIYAQLDQIETTEVNTVSHRPRTDFYFLPLGAALVWMLGSWLFVLPRLNVVRRAPPLPRMRVNHRTFELEVGKSAES